MNKNKTHLKVQRPFVENVVVWNERERYSEIFVAKIGRKFKKHIDKLPIRCYNNMTLIDRLVSLGILSAYDSDFTRK